MKSAGVSKLKASLSEDLAHVKAGEEVLVTERGRATARIVPVDRAGGLSERVRRMARQGRLRLGTGAVPQAFWKARKPRVPEGKVLEALAADREEGW